MKNPNLTHSNRLPILEMINGKTEEGKRQARKKSKKQKRGIFFGLGDNRFTKSVCSVLRCCSYKTQNQTSPNFASRSELHHVHLASSKSLCCLRGVDFFSSNLAIA